ncbi:MAG TPA: multicopper oxidase domain-containing protein, partial [Solirubrobacteraceae bacterium]|nr:multicopper oxidase domain-containing protein [Solirubrobacteraceae bacterium]
AGLHLGRDALVALAAALPLAAFAVAMRGRALAAAPIVPAAPPRPGTAAADVAAEPPPRSATAAPAVAAEPPPQPATAVPGVPTKPPRPEAPAPAVTRRAFVGYGAAGLAGAGVAGVGLSRLPAAARAGVRADRLELFINDGHVAMVDGALVYMRGFGDAPVSDPRPSLTIAPTVFEAGAPGPVASRFHPLLGPDRLPADGVPASAGTDPAGGNLISRRHWASFLPDRTIVAEAGAEIRLRITNRLPQQHAFAIDGVVHETFGPAGSATATKDVAFPAPAPGTYIYHDPTDAPVNRVLGLHGVLMVTPAGNAWSFDGREGEFERQWLWIFHDIDPDWGRRIQAGGTVDPIATPALPRYFTINDRSGVYSLAASPDATINRRTLEDLLPGGYVRRIDVRDFSDPGTGTGQLLRLANTGVAVHQPHWHGNHVWTIAVDNEVQPRGRISMSSDGHPRIQLWEDVVELDPMSTKAVMLPVKRPPDALQQVLDAQACEYEYPMHCHAEMSQSAAGGLYPGGQVAGWRLRR